MGGVVTAFKKANTVDKPVDKWDGLLFVAIILFTISATTGWVMPWPLGLFEIIMAVFALVRIGQIVWFTILRWSISR